MEIVDITLGRFSALLLHNGGVNEIRTQVNLHVRKKAV